MTGITEEDVSHSRPSATRIAPLAAAGVALVILAGVAMRVFVLTHALGVLDADEATTGLVARHILHNHELPVFYWAANYGGTIEAIVTAAAFAVFGSTVVVLKTVAALWYAAACVLAWRVGRRLINGRVGAVAGLLMWVWPGPYLWWSTKSREFYSSVLVLALVVALSALRIAERPDRHRDWLILGFAFGLGWWDNPQIAVIAVPIGLWLAVRNPAALRRAWMAVPTALLGAAPWIVWNVWHHWASFDIPPQPRHAAYLTRYGRFWSQGLPMALGLRVPYAMRWIAHPGPVIYLVLLAAATATLVVRHRWTGAALVAMVLVFSALYAINPLTVISQDGRYVFVLSPVIAIAIAACITWRWVPVAGLTAAVLLSAGSLSAMKNGNSFGASDRIVPVRLGPLLRAMDAAGAKTAIADYGIAYRIDFESHERIIAFGSPYNRYAGYGAPVVLSKTPPAWVFVAGSAADQHFRQAIDGLNEPYRVEKVGGFALYLPDHKLLPGQVPDH